MQQQTSPISPQTTIPITSTAQQTTPKHVDLSIDKINITVNKIQQQNRICKIGQNQKQTTGQKQEQQKQLNQTTLRDIEQNLNANLIIEQIYSKEQNNQDIFLCCVIQQKIDIFSIFYLANNYVQQEGSNHCQEQTQRQQQPQQAKNNPEQNNEQTDHQNEQNKHQQDNETTNKNPSQAPSNTHHQPQPQQPSPPNSPSNSLSQSQQKILKQLLSQIQKSTPPCPKLLQIPQYNKQSQFTLYSQYRKYIVQILQTKCLAEKTCDYIQISFSQYKKILNIWFNLDKVKIKDYVGVDGFLKFGDLRRLAYGRWLNDVLMSAYVAMINASITDYVIYDSLKVTSIFSKKDPKQITRLLQKSIPTNPTNPTNPTPIFLIHHNNHWYFLQLPSSSSPNTTITIYNSLPYKIQSYSSIPLLKQIIDYYSIKYDRKLSYKICQNYPLQNNDCDCGVMALCGIRDVVRKCIVWSFNIEDVGYRRVLITRELLAGCPVDF